MEIMKKNKKIIMLLKEILFILVLENHGLTTYYLENPRRLHLQV